MPYGPKAKFFHNRQVPPGRFDASTFKNVPLGHTDYSGNKFDVPGARAVVGKLKARFGGKWKIQSILTPKK